MLHSLWVAILLLFQAGVAAAAEVPIILKMDADPSEVYMREAKKVEVRVEFEGDASGNPPSFERKWSLVQVNSDGDLVRYIGVLLYSSRKRAHFKKFDVQQNQPETLFYEVVPDGELEPFVKLPRKRLEVRILPRPSLPDVLRGVWQKIKSPRSS